MPLTDTQIRQAKPTPNAYHLTDGKGMYLLVQPNGSKLWRYRYRIGGKQKQYAIGAYPEISLGEAREELLGARKLVKKGIDPVHHRKLNKEQKLTENERTFQVIARLWIEKKKQDWSTNYAQQVSTTFENHVYPAIGQHPIASLTVTDVLEVLEKVQTKAPSLAPMVRQWMSAVFRFAIIRRMADADPAAVLKGEIKRPRPRKKRPLSPDEIPEFLERLDQYERRSQSQKPTSIAIRLLMLTFVRTGELRRARWTEFDWEAEIWRIPPERMKQRREHVVPLSKQAAALLKELQGLTGHRPHLFPNTRNPRIPMNKGTINAALRFMGYEGRLSAHAFRNTASTRLHELGFNTDHIEMQLAHKDGRVRGRYNSARYLEARKQMMQEWANYIDGLREIKDDG